MHILFTNNTLNFLSGSELYIYDLACEFQRRGHQISCFSLKLGLVAERLKKMGITVTSDLSQISGVDIIHGHHPLESRIAAAFFPTVPIVFVSHAVRTELERPGKDNFCFTRYVAISEEVKKCLLEKDGINASRIDLIPNFVDLNRFTQVQGCPASPRRVVALSNHHSSTTEGQVVRSACELAGLELRVVGMGAQSVWEVEENLEWADVVVGAARSALQAMAMGRPTIIYKYTGGDGLVTPANFDQLALTNFGGRTYRRPYTPEELAAEMVSYNLEEVAEVRRRVREERSLEQAANLFSQVYAQALRDFNQNWRPRQSVLRLQSVLKDLGYHLATFKDADLWRSSAEWGLLRYSELDIQLRERNAQLDQAVSERNYYVKDRQILEEFNSDLQRERQVLLDFNTSLSEELTTRQTSLDRLEDDNKRLQDQNKTEKIMLNQEVSKSDEASGDIGNYSSFPAVSNYGEELPGSNTPLHPSLEQVLNEKILLQEQYTQLVVSNKYLHEELLKTSTLLERVNNGRVIRLLNALRKRYL